MAEKITENRFLKAFGILLCVPVLWLIMIIMMFLILALPFITLIKPDAIKLNKDKND
jgi:uncharacterized membrane protein